MRPKEFVLGSRATIAGTVYGTVVVLATETAGEDSYIHDLWGMFELVAVSVIVLWLAHVYAHGIATSLQSGRRLTAAQLADVARHEASIPLAAVLPLAAIALGAMGVLPDHTAFRLSIALGIAILTTQGIRYAQLERLGFLATVFVVGLDLAFGLSIVMLKALVVH